MEIRDHSPLFHLFYSFHLPIPIVIPATPTAIMSRHPSQPHNQSVESFFQSSRPFSPSPPRESRHTASRPPSLLFSAARSPTLAHSSTYSLEGLPDPSAYTLSGGSSSSYIRGPSVERTRPVDAMDSPYRPRRNRTYVFLIVFANRADFQILAHRLRPLR
jgi:hypothetical protein